jgi:hypothetical protein
MIGNQVTESKMTFVQALAIVGGGYHFIGEQDK